MTNERAIELLNRISDSQFDGPHGDERREALEMAVRALSGDGDTISRKMAIEAIEEMQMPIMRSEFSGEQFVFTGMAQALQAIKDLPSAQPERKMGRWINAYPDIEPNPMFMYGICSVCGFEQAISNKLNFCPNCGARMDGESDED